MQSLIYIKTFQNSIKISSIHFTSRFSLAILFYYLHKSNWNILESKPRRVAEPSNDFSDYFFVFYASFFSSCPYFCYFSSCMYMCQNEHHISPVVDVTLFLSRYQSAFAFSGLSLTNSTYAAETTAQQKYREHFTVKSCDCGGIFMCRLRNL